MCQCETDKATRFRRLLSYSWERRNTLLNAYKVAAVHVIRRISYTNALLRSFLRDYDWYVTGT